MALRHLDVVGGEQPASADDLTYAKEALSEAESTLTVVHGLTLPDLETAADGLAHALSRLVAVYIGPAFNIPTETEARAVMRVRAYLTKDDRDDRRDTDEDGLVSDEEIDADLAAQFY